MQTATRISRHHDIDGDCSICQHLLQGQPVARHPCGHAIHSDCYFDKVLAASTDASINADSCEVCRAEVCSKTRGGKDLTQHFASCKQLVASAAATKKKGESRGPRRELDGPRAGFAGSAGTGGHGKSERLVKRKAQEAVSKAKRQKGGFTSVARGELRLQGVAIPVGNDATCLPDALWALMMFLRPSIGLSQAAVQSALMTGDETDPSFFAAAKFAAGFDVALLYKRQIGSPRALFRQSVGAFLVQLIICTDNSDSPDYHYVAYLAATGTLIDNYPRAKVPIIDDGDRSSRSRAAKVFYELFPGASNIRIGAVSEAIQHLKPRTQPIVPSTDSCASGVSYRRLIGPPNPLANIWSTKPTLEDLFFELYDEQIINYSELIDCIK